MKSQKEFDLVYQRGKRYIGEFLDLLVYRKPSIRPSLFGIVISTKVSKKATERNKKRRQIKEILRLKKDEIAPGYMILVVLKNTGTKTEYSDLEKEILGLLVDGGVIKKAE